MCGSRIECEMVPTLDEAYAKLAIDPPKGGTAPPES